MDIATLAALGFAVFGASFLQAATGIGYGVIAGPIFLVFLNGSEAFQISTIHNLLIAVTLIPIVRGGIIYPTLKLLVIGGVVGIAVGFWLQTAVDVRLLKLASIGMISFVTAMLALGLQVEATSNPSTTPNPRETTLIGALSGAMGGMLAMPGPLAASWMSLRGFNKQDVRSTILAFFIFAYGTTLVLYLISGALHGPTVKMSAQFAPFLLVGVIAGNLASRYVLELLFRQILLAVLIATIILLMVSLY